MATPVRSEAARLETIAFGSMSRFSFARSALACARLARSRIVPNAVGKPEPSDMLSSTDRVPTSPRSCCTNRQPSR